MPVLFLSSLQFSGGANIHVYDKEEKVVGAPRALCIQCQGIQSKEIVLVSLVSLEGTGGPRGGHSLEVMQGHT